RPVDQVDLVGGREVEQPAGRGAVRALGPQPVAGTGEDGQDLVVAPADAVVELHDRAGREQLHDLLEPPAVAVGVVAGHQVAAGLGALPLPLVDRSAHAAPLRGGGDVPVSSLTVALRPRCASTHGGRTAVGQWAGSMGDRGTTTWRWGSRGSGSGRGRRRPW